MDHQVQTIDHTIIEGRRIRLDIVLRIATRKGGDTKNGDTKIEGTTIDGMMIDYVIAMDTMTTEENMTIEVATMTEENTTIDTTTDRDTAMATTRETTKMIAGEDDDGVRTVIATITAKASLVVEERGSERNASEEKVAKTIARVVDHERRMTMTIALVNPTVAKILIRHPKRRNEATKTTKSVVRRTASAANEVIPVMTATIDRKRSIRRGKNTRRNERVVVAIDETTTNETKNHENQERIAKSIANFPYHHFCNIHTQTLACDMLVDYHHKLTRYSLVAILA